MSPAGVSESDTEEKDMKRFLPVGLILVGLAALVWGVSLIFSPAGWIVGGVAAVALGVLMVLGEGEDRN